MAERFPSQLHSLARLYDIQTSYFDVKGQRRQATSEGLLGLLRSLGAPVERVQDVPAAVRERQRSLWQRAVDPVAVAWEGSLGSLGVRLPAKMARRAIECQIRLETGESIRWACKPSALKTKRKQDVDGSTYIEQHLAVPFKKTEGLPFGYHRLFLEFDHHHSETLVISAPRQAYCRAAPGTRKSWGVFLPLYAMHSARSWGAGDFTDLLTLTDWIHEVGGDVVATLPLLAVFIDHMYDPSPYAPVSRLFWNEFYVDIAGLPEAQRFHEVKTLLSSPELSNEIAGLRSSSWVEYRRLMALKKRVLTEIARKFVREPSDRRKAFRRYLQEHPDLNDYAEFRAVTERQKTPWPNWPERLREGRLVEEDYDRDTLAYYLYSQWVAEEQLHALAERSRRTGQGLYLDLPLGVHTGGYDVWRERRSFVTEASGGAPPDAVFTKGQDWGFAPLHPEGVRQEEYRYVIAYLRHHMRDAGILRIDHVMGLHRLYMIPKGLEPSQGAYARYRSEELYAILSLESHRHSTWLVGENLGTVPSQINAALARHRIHKMYVVQYELATESHPVLRAVPRDSIASLNTHDMPTFAAYWKGLDIEDRCEMGLLDHSGADAERNSRHALQRTLGKFLHKKGALPTDSPDVAQLLRGCLDVLGASQAPLVLVNLEDLWLEPEPQNVPDSKDQRPNWTRKTRYGFEEMCERPEVVGPLRTLNQLRQGNASGLTSRYTKQRKIKEE